MCLMLGGGMGMPSEPPFPLTPKAKSMTQTLQFISMIHFILAVVLMLYGGNFFSIMTPLILCCATCQYQYFCLMFYIFYSIIDFIMTIEPCGNTLQNMITGNPSIYDTAYLIPRFIMLVFLPIAIRFAFVTYKEYKALQFEAMGMPVGQPGDAVDDN